jgi:reticulocalbin-2
MMQTFLLAFRALPAWILRSFKKLSEEEAEDRFEDLDENNDDTISWAEYVKDVYGMEVDGVKQSMLDDKEEIKLMQDDKEMFETADLNKDGLLSIEEHLKFHHPEEHSEMYPIILKQTLRDKDLNHDGILNFQEFMGDSAKNHDKEWLLSEKQRFDDFDKDKDGFLNHNEILSYVIPSNDEIATDETNHLFAASDEDHDDRLSYNEILDKYDIFVGSEATDYGDHLQNIEEFHDEL